MLVYYHEKRYISLGESGHLLLLLATCIEKIEQGRAEQDKAGWAERSAKGREGQGGKGKEKGDLEVKLEYHKICLYASNK